MATLGDQSVCQVCGEASTGSDCSLGPGCIRHKYLQCEREKGCLPNNSFHFPPHHIFMTHSPGLFFLSPTQQRYTGDETIATSLVPLVTRDFQKSSGTATTHSYFQDFPSFMDDTVRDPSSKVLYSYRGSTLLLFEPLQWDLYK